MDLYLFLLLDHSLQVFTDKLSSAQGHENIIGGLSSVDKYFLLVL